MKKDFLGAAVTLAPASAVEEGDILAVFPDDLLPVDGVLLGDLCENGCGEVSTLMRDGEIGGKAIRDGEHVLSGSIARSLLWVRASGVYAGSSLQVRPPRADT